MPTCPNGRISYINQIFVKYSRLVGNISNIKPKFIQCKAINEISCVNVTLIFKIYTTNICWTLFQV